MQKIFIFCGVEHFRLYSARKQFLLGLLMGTRIVCVGSNRLVRLVPFQCCKSEASLKPLSMFSNDHAVLLIAI
jgi:hypothetical protein